LSHAARAAALKQAIRPIPLTVNRLNPDPIALRVLKRFTFTEEDSAYQWEKLRSAYMLAEWSEEYFNNRALFSDYYLKERLTDEQITPEWREDVKPIGREIFRHLTTARKNYTRQTETVIRKGLFEPVFKLLGFDSMEGKSDSSETDEADYLLYTPGDQTKPIAAALTYVWNRNLDDVDESRERDEADGGTPFEIPGAMVVSLLEKQVAPWVIVTNGKLWRLYSSTASNKATNYYEIDLEEAIAANDQITALKYWWLMFRRQAFTGFLDNLLKNSADYAKELGDRLKDRVFVEIFPQFAKGFIADMRTQGVKETDIDLDVVFSGTMTFLYRLMFTLYAESLELVPINEVRGYREHSLYRMKHEIAAAGGTVLDQSPDKLKAQYKANSTTLYARLSELFTVIDVGSDELNMPTYNGGLFSQETDSGQFLARYGIPDRYLALGLDRLTRDIDQKTQALVFIDFKSLGVRQLGSIYEGLLEFKLNIASEALAVTKEKGKEVYQSAKKVKKPLATLAKGEVYLENDKQERKATGSYYTPDYIVKYIVRHTVGPVLERKFKDCEARLHKAQKGYRDYAKLVEARRKAFNPSSQTLLPPGEKGLKKRGSSQTPPLPAQQWERGTGGEGDNPAVYWNSTEMQQLVDDCLNVRVLDPAMGSGHFLVEVVDYVSNRLIDFLNGWTENPVWAFIDQTRQDIIDDMERQHVTIDADRLTRVALLKRAVLKRCVYGVDLNLMAVELAKVSLWLDAFTLGAPLSFLDHHLKHGNSLIGARVADVQKALEGQQTLFSQNKFAGVMLATDLMRQVSYLSDNTIEQTRRSAQAYRDARDHLAPYKRVLDVYTSRWFGNAPIIGRRGSQGTDVTIEFLQRNDTQAWLEDPRKPENRLPADDYMKAGLVAKTALEAAESKRFFHWELEFPEIFFAPSKPGGQDVQLSKDGSFDAIVGNPPWVDVQDIDDAIKPYLRDVFLSTKGKFDLYGVFIEHCLDFIDQHGWLSMIFQSKFLVTEYGEGLRNALATKSKIRHMVQISVSDVFEGITTYPFILFAGRANETAAENYASAIVIPAERSKRDVQRILESDTIAQDESFQLDSSLLSSDTHWVLEPSEITQLAAKANLISVPFRSFTKAISYGVKTNLDPAYLNSDEEWRNKRIEPRLLRKAFKPRDIDRYELNDTAPDMIFPYDDSGELKLVDINDYPNAKKHFESWRADLEKRRFFGKTVIEHGMKFYELPYVSSHSREPKLIFPTVTSKSTFAYDTGENLFIAPCYIAYLKSDVDYLYILAILNSTFTNMQLRRRSTDLASGYMEMQKQYVEDLPIPHIDFTTPADERERLKREIVGAYDIGDNSGVLVRISEALDVGKSDVVHDLLAHLAQCMIDLNKQKQAEVKRFLDWLEGRLWPPHPKSLSHKGRGTSIRDANAPPLSERSEWERGPGGEGTLQVPPELAKRMVEVARVFRKEPTRSEDVLWQALRNRQLEGRKFRRQQPIGAFVLDFFCPEERLAVEVDGAIHESQQDADRIRQELIEETGIRFVRIPAETVENDLSAALDAIRMAFLPEDPSSQTLLLQGEKDFETRSAATPPLPERSEWERGSGGEGAVPGVRGTIDSLTGKTVLQGYLGDYQKGEGELPWREFLYRLHQNRNRFGASLTDVEGEIEREYENSLATLIPIKRDLARTDALIDKIVYRLYGLTDAEIELIERPQYEQALTDAKAQAIADETITADTEEEKTEQVIEKIAEAILPAAQRFFERIEPHDVEATLDGDLPNWRTLPPDAPTFMLTGDYNLRSLPDHMDFSSSVIPYTKAVEVALHRLIFEPFRTSHSDRDCRNEFLQKFMRGEKELTLGSYMIILSSNRETALRGFISRIVSDVEGLATTLNDTTMRDVRNKAAHDEVLSRDEAQQTRTWAIGILGMV
jgi:very-short-patch-repair endonuclease